MNVRRIGGASNPRVMHVPRIGGACGPPPPFVAPLVPRCALTSGATPRDVLGRRLRLGWPNTLPAEERESWDGSGTVDEELGPIRGFLDAASGRGATARESGI